MCLTCRSLCPMLHVNPCILCYMQSLYLTLLVCFAVAVHVAAPSLRAAYTCPPAHMLACSRSRLHARAHRKHTGPAHVCAQMNACVYVCAGTGGSTSGLLPHLAVRRSHHRLVQQSRGPILFNEKNVQNRAHLDDQYSSVSV